MNDFLIDEDMTKDDDEKNPFIIENQKIIAGKFY